MCQTGTRQSPIDLDPQVAVPGHFEPLVLLNYDKAVAGNITNNGHSGKCKRDIQGTVRRDIFWEHNNGHTGKCKRDIQGTVHRDIFW